MPIKIDILKNRLKRNKRDLIICSVLWVVNALLLIFNAANSGLIMIAFSFGAVAILTHTLIQSYERYKSLSAEIEREERCN